MGSGHHWRGDGRCVLGQRCLNAQADEALQPICELQRLIGGVTYFFACGTFKTAWNAGFG